ncbi:Cytochrome c oxidase assembly protein cox19 [Cryptotrichosporon argae]
MSFGRPGGFDTFKVSPPQRGSFPLDHDGECKTYMLAYMRCIKANAQDNGACRPESRAYLECRMDHGLMQRDDMANLGLGDVERRDAGTSPHSTPAPPPSSFPTASPTSTASTPTPASAPAARPAADDRRLV